MSRQTRQAALAETIGREIAAKLLESLPRIAQAMKREGATASFSSTAQFTTNREGDLICTVDGRERIPVEPTVLKIGLHGDQLKLFDGPARTDDGEDAEE